MIFPRWRTRPQLALVALMAGALLAVLALPGASVPVARAAGADQGLQGGWAVDNGGNTVFVHSVRTQLPIMQEAGAGWVRINFRLGDCFKDWTTRGCNRKTALQAYADVVTDAKGRGLKVLGLLSNESWKGGQSQWTANNAENTTGNGDNRYVKAFAEKAAGVLAKQFNGTNGPRVDAWEVWNEPNSWTSVDAQGNPTGGTYLYPSNFAWLLKRSRAAIAANSSTPVVSGGLLSHDGAGFTTMQLQEDGRWQPVTKRGGVAGTRLAPLAAATRRPGSGVTTQSTTCSEQHPSGAAYLCLTYHMGQTKAGWGASGPFDEVGQHLYVDVGADLTTDESVRARLLTLLDEVRGVYTDPGHEAGTAKQTQVTEFGWTTAHVTEAEQANRLQVAYTTFQDTSYVQRGHWFTAQDVPEGGLYYGLVEGDYAAGDTSTSNLALRKDAFATYQSFAQWSR